MPMREVVTTVLDVAGLVVLAVGGGVSVSGLLRGEQAWTANGVGTAAAGIFLLVGSGLWAWWAARQ